MTYRRLDDGRWQEICGACGRMGAPSDHWQTKEFRTTLIRIGGETRHSRCRVCLSCAQKMKVALDAVFTGVAE